MKADWDEFVESRSLNGTFLHTRKFYDHNPLNAEDDHSLLFFKDNEIAGVIAFNLIDNGTTKILHSYNRATYGGFVMSEETGIQEAVEMVELVIEEAKSLDVQEVIIRNPYRFLHKLYCDETDYAMWLKGFTIKYRELESTIKLDELSRERYQRGAKVNIKKASKSVVVKESVAFDEFWKILAQNLEDKHGLKPAHDLASFHALLENVGSEKIKLFGGYIDDTMVCGIVLFLFEPLSIHAQYIAHDDTFQQWRPLNAVIDFIIEWGQEKGYQSFNFGTSCYDHGSKINYGLFHFKEGFGARGVLRETMHLQV